ncbi:MAG: DUF1465 family protein [Sphingobium sp.]
MFDSDNRLLPIDAKLIEELYGEAVGLSDNAQSYLARDGAAARTALGVVDGFQFSCEALKITTRLMQVIAWLLSRRALGDGQVDLTEEGNERYRLGESCRSEPHETARLPIEMRVLIASSESLYRRAQRLEERLMDRGQSAALPGGGPARELIARLRTSF